MWLWSEICFLLTHTHESSCSSSRVRNRLALISSLEQDCRQGRKEPGKREESEERSVMRAEALRKHRDRGKRRDREESFLFLSGRASVCRSGDRNSRAKEENDCKEIRLHQHHLLSFLILMEKLFPHASDKGEEERRSPEPAEISRLSSASARKTHSLLPFPQNPSQSFFRPTLPLCQCLAQPAKAWASV